MHEQLQKTIFHLNRVYILYIEHIFLTKITAMHNEVALSYHRVRGLYTLAVIFAANIARTRTKVCCATNPKLNLKEN